MLACALFAAGIAAVLQGQWTAPGPNVAAGRPYELDPAPNYPYCTDPGDATQLTDGQYVEGYFWTQKGTVGWQNANPVTITIDLGRDGPLCGASFDTAAGRAGVRRHRAGSDPPGARRGADGRPATRRRGSRPRRSL